MVESNLYKILSSLYETDSLLIDNKLTKFGSTTDNDLIVTTSNSGDIKATKLKLGSDEELSAIIDLLEDHLKDICDIDTDIL